MFAHRTDLHGGDSDYYPVYASSGDGDEGVVFPNETVADRMTMWIRHLQDGVAEDLAFRLGVE